MQKLRIENGEYPLVENVQDLARLNQAARMKLVDEVYERTQILGVARMSEALFRVLQNAERLIRGEVDPLELFVKHEIPVKIYECFDTWDYQEFFAVLTHSKPHLRILEIGAGTGTTTAALLKNLKSQYGERMYAQYSFTDISAGFFATAKKRFEDFSGMDFAILDISKDPTLQGFKANSYDLIIASNVIHATPRVRESLVNIHKLLHPSGRLFLQELCPQMKWINFVFGWLKGWWLGAAEDRLEEPYISPERWNLELQAAGFSQMETILYDYEPPYQINANMLVQPHPNFPSGAFCIKCNDCMDLQPKIFCKKLLENGKVIL